MDIAKTTTEITLLRRALKTAPTVSIKVKIKSKIARLKQYIEDSSVPTAKLAKSLLGSKRKVLAYSTQEFNDAIGRLSMKGEYSFLKGMGKGKIKDDLKREAKPVGYRFVGRDNFKKPTRQEIIDGRKNGTVYMENRANRSDVVRPAKLEYGGVITQEQYDEITTEHRPFAVKSGSSIRDVINSTIALNLACKKRDVSVQDYKNYGKFAKGGAMEHGLKKGDTIKDDLFWEDSVVVNNSKTGIAKVDLDKGTRTQMVKGGVVGLDSEIAIRKKVNDFLTPLGYSAKVEDIGNGDIHIEPSTRKVGNNRSDFFDGMQITRWKDGVYEVSEYQAGVNENELYIYKETNSLIIALKDLIKGNKRKPIKKYANGGGVGENFKISKIKEIVERNINLNNYKIQREDNNVLLLASKRKDISIDFRLDLMPNEIWFGGFAKLEVSSVSLADPKLNYLNTSDRRVVHKKINVRKVVSSYLDLEKLLKNFLIKAGELDKKAKGGGVEIKEGEDYLYGRVVGKNYTYTNNKIPNFSLKIGIFKEGKSPNNHYAYLSVPNNIDASILSNLLNKSGSINNSNNSYSNQFSRYDLSEDEVKTIINHFTKISGTKKMGYGGLAESENKEMVLNNNKQIAHHTKEMSMAVKNAKNVPAWVVAKVNRSASDLSDATHYMEGQDEQYANGGVVSTLLQKEKEKLQERLNDSVQKEKLSTASAIEESLNRVDYLIEYEQKSGKKISSKEIKNLLNPYTKWDDKYNIEEFEYAKGGAVPGAKFTVDGKDFEVKRVEQNTIYTTNGKMYSLKALNESATEFIKERKKSDKPRGVRGERREQMESELDELWYDLQGYKKDLKQLNFDMELEAGEKGGKWTDADGNRYGGELNKLEEKIESLKKQIAEKELKLSYKHGGEIKGSYTDYERQVTDELCDIMGITNSDAQGIVENNEQLIEESYDNGYSPNDVALIIDGGYMAKGGVTEYRKGGNITSIEKRVLEVNEMIKKGNELGIKVVDESVTWESPMKYKPLKYSNGVLYIEYQELDLYKYKKGMGTVWKTKKDKLTKNTSDYGYGDAGYAQKLELSNIAKMYRKALNHYEKYGYYEKGGGVANSTTNVTNDMRGEDSDDYGTFEIYKNGGEIKVSVVNSNKQYNEKAYNWILGDFDKDGVANADDTKPLDKNKTKRIDEPSITSGIKSLISLKNTLDSKMYSFIDELKDVAPNKSKIYARTKTPYSVLDKLIKKRLSTITDLIGTTVVTNDKNELDAVKKYVQSGEMGKVIEFEDMYKSPKKGYRAYHFLIDRDGMSIELQLKTKRQKALNELTHEPYKLGNINVPLQLKMTEVANRADEGDKDAIKEYNEFMKQPNIEKVFYAKSGDKMAKGSTVTTNVKAILDAKRAKIKSRKSKR